MTLTFQDARALRDPARATVFDLHFLYLKGYIGKRGVLVWVTPKGRKALEEYDAQAIHHGDAATKVPR
jgi:hypothetical protein